MLEIVHVPLLIDNYGYLLHDPDTGATAVVDPSQAAPVLKILKERNWKLTSILNTHHHYDHVDGNEEIKAHTNCNVIGSYTDRNRIPEIDQTVREGDEITIGNSKAKILEIPGHTVGHIAFWFAAEQAIFCGDTLFSLGCGRLFEGSPEQMWTSLRRLAQLPRDTKVYCGHEYTQANADFALEVDPHNPTLQDYRHRIADLRQDDLPTVPSTIDIEVKCNPFLRAPQLAQSLGLPEDIAPHEAFAELRRRKDQW